jgi:hypothetical protein
MKVAWLTTIILLGMVWLAPSASAETVEPVVSVRHQAENIGSIESESSSTVPARRGSGTVRAVSFHGHFIDIHAPVPRGDRAPSGTDLTYRINAQGQIVEEELGGSEASQWPASATVASRRGGTAHSAARRRRMAHAAATWKCKLGGAEEEHCYALSIWWMKGGEHVEGAEALINTEEVDAYEWESGAFVSNEMWLSWTSNQNQWVEAGQIAGDYINCCSIQPFVAYKIPGQSFKIDRDTELDYNTHQYYQYQISGQSDDGHWCLYIGETQITCPYFGTGYKTATDLEDGMEAGANKWEANNGVNQVNGWWEHVKHHWLFDELWRETDTCILRPSGAPWAGDVQYATCQEP